LLKRFWQLPKEARPDAVAALTVREPWALALLEQVEKGEVPKELVTASDARQMSSLGSKKVDERLSEVWGTIRTTPAAVRADIERLRDELTPDVLAKADLANGRGLFSRMCGNCHKLYGEGTAVAPDLTGGNRASLDYLLENLLDPSATVPEAYRSSVIVLKDGRVLTGVITGRSENRLTLQTATDKQTLDAADVEEIKPTELSLMPNGQLDRLSDEEVRDLIAYLQSKSQVPLAGQ
jgi:putative heme-binding domain-containing protein